jgi:signal transduction histidine kinase
MAERAFNHLIDCETLPMPRIDPVVLIDALPQLRSRFEASLALAQRARERALRAAEHAAAMRQLLERRMELSRRHSNQRAIWDAAAAEILEASASRDRAVGILAHELRQPLAAALAAHQLLAKNPRPEVAARANAVLDRQLLQLANVVDTLLDFSRLQLKSMQIERRRIDLRTALVRAVESIESLVFERGQLLTVETGSDPLLVMGDEARLIQVFSNLLQNAVRYTPDGGSIEVTATAAGGEAIVTVADSGVGVPPALQATIFEPFTRASPHGAGLGIGLALARAVVELHGGEIALASTIVDGGSTFTVALPLADGGIA